MPIEKQSRLLVVAWERFQARTSVLGPALGGESVHIYGGWTRRHPAFLPLRYLVDAARMWRLLRRHHPEVLVVISPPIVAPAVGWLWCLIRSCKLVVDCHTPAFHGWKWGWTRPIHRLLFRRAAAVLLHTEGDESLVASWGVPALLLADDLPDRSQAAPPARRATAPSVVVAGSLDANEPVAAALAAAALLPDMEVRFTGDVARLADSTRSTSPANAILTGFLPYPEFLGELLAADVVAVFSTDPRIMNRAAFEAIGLGRALVLSDLPGLRARFGQAALFCPNEPAAMAQTIRQAQRDRLELIERASGLETRLRTQRETALTELRSMIDGGTRSARAVAEARLQP